MVYCPACGKQIPAFTDLCPSCQTDVTPLQESRRLREAAEGIQRDLVQLTHRVDLHARSVQSHDERLNDFLKTDHSQPSSPVGEPLRANAPTQDPSPPVPPPAVAGTVEPPLTPARSTPPAAKLSESTEAHFGQKWLLILGILSTLSGLAYFLKLVWSSLGPVEKVLTTYSASLLMLGLGDFFRKRNLGAFGPTLMGGAVAALYLSTYAATNVYGLLGVPVAAAVLIAVTGFGVFLSLGLDQEPLAALAFVGGYLTPAMLGYGHWEPLGLVVFTLVLNLGLLAVSFKRRWNFLQLLGFFGTWIMLAGWIIHRSSAATFAWDLVLVNSVFLTYLIAPYAYHFLKREGNPAAVGMVLAFLTAFLSFASCTGIILLSHPRWVLGVVSASYAAAYIVLARILRIRNPKLVEPYVLLLFQGMFFLTLTIPLLLDGTVITVFWALEGAVLVMTASRIKRSIPAYWGLAALLLALFKLQVLDFTLWEGFDSIGSLPEATARIVTWIFTLGAAGLASAVLRREKEWLSGAMAMSYLLGYLTWGWLFLCLQREVMVFSTGAPPQVRAALVSVFWGLYAAFLMAAGFTLRSGNYRMAGLFVFVLALLKVFFFDLEYASTPLRVLSYVALGILLILTSYLYHRFRSRLEKT